MSQGYQTNVPSPHETVPILQNQTALVAQLQAEKHYAQVGAYRSLKSLKCLMLRKVGLYLHGDIMIQLYRNKIPCAAMVESLLHCHSITLYILFYTVDISEGN